ncbi:MAG: DUF2283 domain-containing protein [Solirubrobacterales bacterium]
MTLSIAGIEFDHHDYDERGDTLYLHVGPPREPARALETPEGHTVEYDEQGAVIGLELMNVRTTLARAGAIAVTWPQAELSAQQLDPVLAPA